MFYDVSAARILSAVVAGAARSCREMLIFSLTVCRALSSVFCYAPSFNIFPVEYVKLFPLPTFNLV